MTTTTHEIDQAAAATAVPALSFTVPAGEFVMAVRNVAPFAGTDVTLPSLVGVHCELAADGTLTLVATDRYVLGHVTINLTATEHAAHAGEGSVFLAADVVKVLSAVKADRQWCLITVTVAQDGMLTIALPDTRVMTWPASHADYGFPKWRSLESGFKPAADMVVQARFNPSLLVKFSKIRQSGRGGQPPEVTFEFSGDTLTRFTCGDVAGLIVQMRPRA